MNRQVGDLVELVETELPIYLWRLAPDALALPIPKHTGQHYTYVSAEPSLVLHDQLYAMIHVMRTGESFLSNGRLLEVGSMSRMLADLLHENGYNTIRRVNGGNVVWGRLAVIDGRVCEPAYAGTFSIVGESLTYRVLR